MWSVFNDRLPLSEAWHLLALIGIMGGGTVLYMRHLAQKARRELHEERRNRPLSDDDED